MPYLGNAPSAAFQSVAYQDLTGGTGTSFTLSHAVSSAQEIEVFVNNVRQEPTVAYSAVGTTLTMTGTIAATDDFYVVFQGKAVGSVSHPTTSPLAATTGTFSGNVTSSGTVTATSFSGDGSALTGISAALKKTQIIPIPPQAITGSAGNIPRDNTLPLITEGHQIVQANYTPAETTSTIFADATFYIGERTNVANVFASALFFNDTCVNVRSILGVGNQATWVRLQASFSNTTGNALDIEIRCDENSAFEINGQHLGTASTTYVSNAGSAFGGTDAVNQTYITVTEF